MLLPLSNNSISEYFIPCSSAAIANIPTFIGLIGKSQQQLNRPLSHLKIAPIVIKSFSSSPICGAVVGTQISAQKLFGALYSREPSTTTLAVSSMTIGLLSVPILSIYNGKTTGLSTFQSLKKLSVNQSLAITFRESLFLFSLEVSKDPYPSTDPLLSKNKVSNLAASFFSTTLASFINHPADTLLTLWQNQKKYTDIKSLYKGVGMRSISSGIFAVIYNEVEEKLKTMSLSG